nr:type I-E CRISPR-associated protein Cas5/CasD [Actinopolymorpha cephalotaxi]
MQSWGSRSRFVRRETERAPTKSGVIGILAAARGMRRTDDLTELLGLRFAVRVDQPGTLIRDFQTARSLDGSRAMPLSYRHYMADAVYVAVLEGDCQLLAGLDAALRAPVFPLYLGRRSCPPVQPLSLGVRDGSLTEVISAVSWQASQWYRRRRREPQVSLEVIRDAHPDEQGDVVRDEPESFDPQRREYGWRPVVRETVSLTNPDISDSVAEQFGHDPMALLGG